MKLKNIFLLVGGIILLVVAAVMFANLPTDSIFAKAAVEKPVVQVVAPKSEEKPVVEASVPEEEVPAVELPTAVLTVIADNVKMFDFEKVDFVLIETDTVDVKEGDCIRTLKEGLANIKFTEDIQLNLEPNSEICILTFRPDPLDETITNLYIGESIGDVFFTVNDPDKKWNVKLITPVSFVWSDDDAFSYQVKVIYPGTENFTPEEMEKFIEENPALISKTVCTKEDGTKYFCNGCVTCSLLIKSNPIKTVVLDESGEVKITYLQIPDGLMTKVLIAAEQFEYSFSGYKTPELWRLFCQTMSQLINGETVPDSVIQQLLEPETPEPQPQPTIVVPLPCGDNVCDIYGGENATTCPVDCGG